MSRDQQSQQPPLRGAVAAVFRHELRLLLYTPLSYLFQIGFLGALSASIFLVADFYSTDEASLRLMGVFLPWIALILVPALAMRSWPDSHADRSVELAMTLPVPTGAVVTGKFLAGYTVLLVTLLFTVPMAATVVYLGEPDPGVMAATYLAAGLLLAVYYAVSLFASALAREPIAAFVIALVLLLILLLLGWDVFGRLLKQTAPAPLIDALGLYSPYTWMTRMGQGAVELGGVCYFAAVTGFALWATAQVIEGRRQGGTRTHVLGKLATGLAILIIAVPLFARVPSTFDLTEAGEFTLHEGTRSVLDRIPDDTKVTLHWSAHEASVPANIKSHARRIRALLSNMAALSNGHLSFEEVDPKPDTDAELTALAQGVRRIPLSSGDAFFLGLTASHGKRMGNIPYLDIRRDRLTEYDIALTLNGLGREKTPKVGLLSPLVPSQAAVANRQGMAFIAELKRTFDLAIIPFFKPVLPQGLDTLIVIDASILRTDMLYAIDQFVMNGGSLVVMVDPHLRANQASNAVTPQPSDEVNDIADLLDRYGLTYLNDKVVGDRTTASVVTDRNQRSMSYPFWMRLRTANLSRAHPTTASLNEVFFVEPGAFDVSAPDRVTPLVTTGVTSGALSRDAFAGALPGKLIADFKPDGKTRVLAAAITGPLSSAFEKQPEGFTGKPHRRRSGDGAAVFAVADVDWLFDPFSLQRTEIDGRVVVRPLNDNLAFLQNILEFAGGDRSLIGIRSRGQVQRPFTRVETMFKDAQDKYRADETRIASRIAEVERLLAQVPETAGVQSVDQLPASVRTQVEKLQKDMLPLRRELREVRRSIREGVDELGRRVTLVNLISGPALVLVFCWLVSVLRRRRSISSDG